VVGFVTELRRPSVLLLEGQAGIGKTSLWRVAAKCAHELQVQTLTAFPTAAETKLPYAGLSDLLEGLDEQVGTLPQNLRRALDVALLRLENVPYEGTYQRAIAAATLHLLRNLANQGPAVVAIDDVQWLDAPSAEALAFAFRRLEERPAGLLITARSGESKPVAFDRIVHAESFRRMELDPLTLDDLDLALLEHLGQRLPLSVLIEVGRSSAGNPLFALELGRALLDGRILHRPGRPLNVPTDLRALVGERLAALPAEAIELLATVSAMSHPTRELIEKILPDAHRRIRLAIDDGLLQERGDRLVAAHPLYGSVPMAEMATHDRRDLYARASAAATDLEEKARLLALSTDPPNGKVAQVLEEAGRHAEHRGAPDIGAALLEQALTYSAPEDSEGRLERTSAAARCFLKSNRADRAARLFEQAIANCRPGDRRARLMFERLFIADLPEDQYLPLAERILNEAEDPSLRARVHCQTAWELITTFHNQSAKAHVAAAHGEASSAGDAALLARAMGLEATLSFFDGEGVRRDLADRAIELERRSGTPSSTVDSSPRYLWAIICLWADLLDESRFYFLQLRSDALAESNEPELWLMDWYLMSLEWRAGNWKDARRYALSCDRLEELLYGRAGTSIALIDALQGNVAAARQAASAARDRGESDGEPFKVIQSQSVLGLAELTAGDHQAVIAHLSDLPGRLNEVGVCEPGHFRFHPDLVEAYVAVGQLEEAKRVGDHLESLAAPTGRRAALAALARCRGWIAVNDGHPEIGLRSLEESVGLYRALGQPFELGRTLLLTGSAQRRSRMWAKARVSLDEARDIFLSLGSPPWAAKAAREVEKIGGRSPSRWELTPAEEQMANLAGQGRTNREIAEELFVSIKTVEWTLSKVYRKLQVRSRTELAARPRN
jgi:DNA-binding CsgD family transcriptional regulator